jgi:hypothetical protein
VTENNGRITPRPARRDLLLPFPFCLLMSDNSATSPLRGAGLRMYFALVSILPSWRLEFWRGSRVKRAGCEIKLDRVLSAGNLFRTGAVLQTHGSKARRGAPDLAETGGALACARSPGLRAKAKADSSASEAMRRMVLNDKMRGPANVNACLPPHDLPNA